MATKQFVKMDIEALLNSLIVQEHNLSEQLTMTRGAIQVLQHLLSDNDVAENNGGGAIAPAPLDENQNA